ncbi:hypothetical protein NBT05_05870 [Aquimarina sp. ERC-38]|uniref:DUF6973 domain-containing protein n=1 Tax=Aquimarina sp. ERC-38 TaxID=2949996 RepID=UPI00224809A1|nr:hypothetical protein [Aquimarina sp. ERC-38]UZO81993.1 hypothetical protein NBT05_05870 [Aquimarina sp. ERC-38]
MIKKPLYIWPTLQATKQTITICDQLYHKEHHLTGKPNAFRHALWNILISKNVFKINKNIVTSITWAKTITDLHEELAPNDLLDKTMDLHNNKMGREIFRKNRNYTIPEFLEILDKNVKEAKEVSNLQEFKTSNNNLVYLV